MKETSILASDRERLRRLGEKQAAYPASPQNETILKKWRAQAEGRRQGGTKKSGLPAGQPGDGTAH